MKTSPKTGRKIAIVGAGGNLGTQAVAALLSKSVHTITAISRTESTATFPEGVIVKRGDYSDPEFRKSALQGQDVLVVMVGFLHMKTQEPFIRSAAEAGVAWILPTEFGSDTTSKSFNEELVLFGLKARMRDLIEELGISSWVAVVTNPWYDFSLKPGHFGIDTKNRSAKFWGQGNVSMPTTTLRRAGEGIGALLSLPEEELSKFRNGHFYIHSFMATQQKILDAVIAASGTTTEHWQVENVDILEAYADAKKRAMQGDVDGMVEQLYILHFMEGRGGDYSEKMVPNQDLGLQDEDIVEVTRAILAESSSDGIHR
jgi:hypothetical protein